MKTKRTRLIVSVLDQGGQQTDRGSPSLHLLDIGGKKNDRNMDTLTSIRDALG